MVRKASLACGDRHGCFRVEANLPTPWAGVTERITIYGSMLWFAALAITLLRAGDAKAPG